MFNNPVNLIQTPNPNLTQLRHFNPFGHHFQGSCLTPQQLKAITEFKSSSDPSINNFSYNMNSPPKTNPLVNFEQFNTRFASGTTLNEPLKLTNSPIHPRLKPRSLPSASSSTSSSFNTFSSSQRFNYPQN